MDYFPLFTYRASKRVRTHIALTRQFALLECSWTSKLNYSHHIWVSVRLEHVPRPGQRLLKLTFKPHSIITSQISPYPGNLVLINHEPITFRLNSWERARLPGQESIHNVIIEKVYQKKILVNIQQQDAIIRDFQARGSLVFCILTPGRYNMTFPSSSTRLTCLGTKHYWTHAWTEE